MDKEPRSYFVRTQSGYTYSIKADFIEFAYEEGVVYFKKDLPDQTNIDNTTIWIVAFVKIEDIEFVGIDGFFK